jgi:hypothetical protein
MKISMSKTGEIDPSREIDQEAVETALSRMAKRRARSFAHAMTNGLRTAANYAEQTKLANDDVSQSFSSVKRDAGHVQFAAQDGPHTQVGEHVLTEVEVGVVQEPTPSGRDPEAVARAFEFGSVAWDTPATAFSQAVVQEQQDAARNDLKEVARVLDDDR